MGVEYHLTGSLDSERTDETESRTQEADHLLNDESTGFVRRYPHRSFRAYVHVIVLYSIIIVLSCAVLFLQLRLSHSADPSQQVWSPAEEAIEYEIKDFDLWFIEKSPYMGYPTDEIDARWEELYNFGITEISKTEADKLSNATLPKPGTEKYLLELDVFHQLHCLNDLRKAFYPERYPGKWPYKKGKVDYKSITFMHWDHCIDALRQTLMCHGDVSVLPFHINHINQNLVPELATRHTCRNFERIQDWARERQAETFERRPGVDSTVGHT